MGRRDHRAYVLTSLATLCKVCAGRPMQLRFLDGHTAITPVPCPHCGYRYGIPYLSAPSYQDRKI